MSAGCAPVIEYDIYPTEKGTDAKHTDYSMLPF